MATIVAIIDASWSGDTLTFVASRAGTQLATGAATLAQLAGNTYKATGTVDLSGAGAGVVDIALNDASGSLAWSDRQYCDASGNLYDEATRLAAIEADTNETQGVLPGSTIAAASDVSAIGTASDRSLRRPADAFIFRVARRSDGTYTTDRTLRLRPGTTESIRVGLDMSRLAPRQFVYSVGTPSVSAGSLTATSPERYDELATYVVGGTATASESRTIDVTVTMEQGDVFNVTLPVEVFAD